MKGRSIKVRRAADFAIRVLASGAALVGIGFLGWILIVVLGRGIGSINWAFFTEMPAPPGIEGGGLANAIVGTVLMTFFATGVGVPIGMLAGIFLAEFGRETRLAEWVRFGSNILMGVPSIITGVFVYIILVVPMQNFSGVAGAVALAIIMLPVVTRTTEDMLNLVPNTLRESALALGAPRWKVTLGVVFRGAKTGLVTGVLLAVARVSGETAPLLFTALNSPYWPRSLNEPTANLTVTIFNYAMSPYPDWQAKAWGASFLITAGVLGATLFTRGLLWYRSRH
ncbi:MAG: phosphate ABC transporter permease PstA [Desulfuromonadales bacterium]|nr:phosphate ABC transporter permease PstA [Desulfuromonadales bacterium]